jgi:NADPH:quinone reductase-like Zn-dependent oxidoreductase
MKAVVLYEYGDIDKLQYETNQQEPPFGPNEVRVRVRATSINPIDWKLRSGAARSLACRSSCPPSLAAISPVKSSTSARDVTRISKKASASWP